MTILDFFITASCLRIQHNLMEEYPIRCDIDGYVYNLPGEIADVFDLTDKVITEHQVANKLNLFG